MFEKELEEYKNQLKWKGKIFMKDEEICFKDGIELGYNKANEWHYVKDGDLPNEDRDENILVYHTSYGGYCAVGYFNVKDKCFRDRDIIAWKEIELPKERK